MKAGAPSDRTGSKGSPACVARLSKARRSGFALIEALAAFLILTLVLGSLLQGVGGGARNESRGDFLLRATRQGRSQLEALGVAAPLIVGETSGRYADGLLWSLAIGPCRSAPDLGGLGETIGCFVGLTIRRPGDVAPGDILTLRTVKIDASRPQR
ncbi:type II secretion system protein [Methylosinus sp. H3A]|uniref:type IV pilus modification PilV family protein n=1 Tax=Methylosinus sp. H3A TaxID=2785786 RepID=UPI0018C32EC0|nr:type II secretion system protein [Methylosinus sp. H3A]MBG0808327.1 type II secretion system protein [Methylosinus sp. H3A]